jgi:hypothetical protein
LFASQFGVAFIVFSVAYFKQGCIHMRHSIIFY